MRGIWASVYAAVFGLSLVAAVLAWPALPLAAGPLRIDAVTGVMAPAVALLAWVVLAFAQRYMHGERGAGWFQTRLGVLAALVLGLVVADNLVLFVVLWAAMGWLLGGALGTNRLWPQARAAAWLARSWFLAGSAALIAACALLAGATGSLSLHTVASQAVNLDPALRLPAGLLVIAAAAIQSGLVPAHLWLTSSLTAPTPVSAIMHAGLVNAGGFLVARFAPLLGASPVLLGVLVAVGGVSALLAALTALVQTDVKRALAHSTVSQMGFMIVQAGLGFFAAALAHLLLHGLFKASLFLGAGSALDHAKPPHQAKAGRDRLALVAGLAGAILAGAVFAAITGKGQDLGMSGSALVVFAVLAAAQVAVTASRAAGGNRATRRAVLLLGLPAAGAVYGIVVAALQAALAGLPALVQPQPLNGVHVFVTGAFVLAWLGAASGHLTRSPRVYAWILALGQPARRTVSTWRGSYHV